MNKSFVITGILFTAILGTVLHFTYDWSGSLPPVGLIAPVSESVWEHLKLLFFPMLIFGLFTLGKERNPCQISAYCGGILFGVFLIPTLYYLYVMILGTNFLAADISIFYLSVIAAFLFYSHFAANCALLPYRRIVCGAVLLLMICFFIFTYQPPSLPIFISP